MESFEITMAAAVLAFAAAMVVGLSKAGIKGIAVVNVTLMALAFEARRSTGIVVPLLIFGDLFAVVYYNRHAQWHYIVRFLPWILLGMVIGAWVGNDLSGNLFKMVMAVIILTSVLMMFLWDRKSTQKVPTHWFFAGTVGVMTGITTMIGNLGGAFSNLYFLAMRVPKNEFIGTAAWLFLIINLAKLPLHIYVWKTITMETFLFDLKLLPGIALGIVLGVRMVNKINERFYRKMIMALTAAGAFLILVR